MIYQNNIFENTENLFADAVKDLQISKLLHKSNVRKSCGVPVSDVFQLLLLLAAKVTSVFSSLTRPERVKVLVLDDSVVTRGHSRAVELLARIYDHVDHKYKRGFTMLTLGWSDGYSFIPVGFNLLSSAKKSNRYQEISEDIDHRTNGFRARKEALMKKTDAAVLLVRRALQAGIQADYVLMDTWFTTEPMIRAMLTEGIHVIRMVKQLKQTYLYHGRYYTLPKLQKFMQHDGASSIFGSVVVTTKNEGIPVKIVFVRNRNKSSECLYILSTDCSLSESEIIRTYGNRWSILYELCSYTNFYGRNALNISIRASENSYKAFQLKILDKLSSASDHEASFLERSLSLC